LIAVSAVVLAYSTFLGELTIQTFLRDFRPSVTIETGRAFHVTIIWRSGARFAEVASIAQLLIVDDTVFAISPRFAWNAMIERLKSLASGSIGAIWAPLGIPCPLGTVPVVWALCWLLRTIDNTVHSHVAVIASWADCARALPS
jgi:hypothetical protein